MKTIALALICLLSTSLISMGAGYVPSPSRAPEPTREFRGAWVASVHNVDWPSRKGLSASQQRSELIAMLDSAARIGVNAVIFQVRTECDALYQSKYEPWSAWLTGTQGKSPGYDPLSFAIAESHKRGMELHAWFNPFRASASDSIPKVSNHISRTHPSSMMRAGTQVYANPSSSYVRQRAINVIMDVVQRYDVDGIHIDDYFYPYPKKIGGVMRDQFDDSASYNAYRRSGGKLGLHDWRRSNINSFIQTLYGSIKKTRSSVKFGISPFGIWRPGVPRGIEASIDPYQHLAADSRRWLNEGWVDYFSPQLYWRISDRPHSFMTLAKWWSGENKKGRHLWPGIASSRIQSSDDPGRPASETIQQIDVTRSVAATRYGSGHVHWSISALQDDRGGVRNLLGRSYASTPLIPATPWLGSGSPADLWVVAKPEANSVYLQFRPTPDARWRVVQIRDKSNSPWRTLRMIPGAQNAMRINGKPYEIALRNVSPTGMLSAQTVIRLQ